MWTGLEKGPVRSTSKRDPTLLMSNGGCLAVSGGEIGMLVLDTVSSIWRQFASGKAIRAIAREHSVGLRPPYPLTFESSVLVTSIRNSNGPL
jgi:hypothetical protein